MSETSLHAMVPVAQQVSERTLMSTAEPIDGAGEPLPPASAKDEQPRPPDPSMPPPPDDGGSRMPVRRPSRAERVSFLEQMHTEGKMTETDYHAAMQAVVHDADDANDDDVAESAPHHPLASATASTRSGASTTDVELAVV